MPRKYEKNKDLKNRRYGRLTIIGDVIKKLNENAKGHRYSYYVECLCDCGNKVVVRISNLKTSRTKSCGCYQKDCLSNRMRGRSNFIGISKKLDKYIIKYNDMLQDLYHYFITSLSKNPPMFKDFCLEIKNIIDKQILSSIEGEMKRDIAGNGA